MSGIKVLCFIAGCFAPLLSFALGLGNLELHSALDQPFLAHISLLEFENNIADTLQVSLVLPKEMEQDAFFNPALIQQLQVAIENNTSEARLVLSSSEPITEPMFSFTVQLNWQDGKLLREYTVLLDPLEFGSVIPLVPFKELPVTIAAVTTPTPKEEYFQETPVPIPVPVPVFPLVSAQEEVGLKLLNLEPSSTLTPEKQLTQQTTEKTVEQTLTPLALAQSQEMQNLKEKYSLLLSSHNQTLERLTQTEQTLQQLKAQQEELQLQLKQAIQAKVQVPTPILPSSVPGPSPPFFKTFLMKENLEWWLGTGIFGLIFLGWCLQRRQKAPLPIEISLEEPVSTATKSKNLVTDNMLK